jgi:hypothetical protein
VKTFCKSLKLAEPGQMWRIDPRFNYQLKVNQHGAEYRAGDAHNPDFRQRVVIRCTYVDKQNDTDFERPRVKGVERGNLAAETSLFKNSPARSWASLLPYADGLPYYLPSIRNLRPKFRPFQCLRPVPCRTLTVRTVVHPTHCRDSRPIAYPPTRFYGETP